MQSVSFDVKLIQQALESLTGEQRTEENVILRQKAAPELRDFAWKLIQGAHKVGEASRIEVFGERTEMMNHLVFECPLDGGELSGLESHEERFTRAQKDY